MMEMAFCCGTCGFMTFERIESMNDHPCFVCGVNRYWGIAFVPRGKLMLSPARRYGSPSWGYLDWLPKGVLILSWARRL